MDLDKPFWIAASHRRPLTALLLVWLALFLVAGTALGQGITIIDSSPLPNGQVSFSYGYTFTTSGGSPPVTWSQPAGTLPPGITFSGGTLSGTPTTFGTYTFDIRASTPSSGTSTRQFELTIDPPPLQITSPNPLPSGVVGFQYNYQMTATGGSGTGYNFSVSFGSLPSGLSMAGNGLITGTPAGPTTAVFSVTVFDSLGNYTQESEIVLTISSTPPLTFTGSCPSTSLPFGPINIPAQASGGTSPYNYFPASPAWVTYNVATANFTGTPPAPGNYTISARVTDSNDGAATFSCSITVEPALGVSGSCPTNSMQGSAITPFTLTASGGARPYSWTVVSPSWLQLGTASGATAQFTGTPTSSGTIPVSIRVNDAIGSSPAIFTCNLAVAPQLALTSTCNTAYPSGPISFPVSATGGFTPYTFSATTLTWLSYSGGATSGAFQGTPPAPGSYTSTFRVTDANSNISSRVCSFTVVAAMSVSGSCPTSATAGSPITPFTLTVSGGQAPFTWNVSSPSWLQLGTVSGNTAQFTGTPPTPGTYPVSITVNDAVGSTQQVYTCSIVVGAALSLTGTCPSTTLPLGSTVTIPVTASGGTGGYTFQSVTPAWLSYNASAGAFTGTPPAAGTYPVTLRVTDSSSSTANFNCSVIVASALSATGSCPSSATAGVAITPFTLTASGGQGPYSWSVTSPPWLQLGPASGATAQFSGTPPSPGTAAVSIRVTDAIGSTAGTFTCSIPVQAALQLNATCPTSTVPIGGTVSIPVSASGGAGGYTFTAVTPTWLTYNANAGAFTGTPPGAGSYPVTLRVMDSSEAQATAGCTVTVGSALTATGTCPTSGTVGTPITPFTLTAAGGQSPYTWSVTSPAWLQLGPASGANAQFAGTPTTAGTAAVAVRVTDAIGTPAGNFTCSIPIQAALQLTGTCPTTTFPIGATVSIPVSATGGSGGYTFTSVTPAWLSYNASAGAFTGTPPGAGTYPVTLRVTDSSGAQATFNCTVTVGAALSATGTCPTSATVGTAITPFTLTAAGGQSPYTWVVSSPAWLQLGTASGATAQFSGTPTSAGAAAVAVRVTDAIGTPAATFTCSIPVQGALQLTGTCPTTTFPVGAAVSIPVSATGGSGGYTFTSVTPTWLSYNASAGAFTGTPPGAGSYPLTLRVTDSSGAQATFNCTITVGAALSATGTCPTNATIGTAIAPFTLNAVGGQGPYTWAIESPTWLQRGPASGATAEFTGTPTTAGPAAVSIRLTDSIGTPAATFTCSIPVQTQLQLTGTCRTTSYPVGVALGIPVEASGGSGGYTFVAISPSWLTYSADAGAFTGTPPAAGSYAVALRVTDSSGAQANFTCNITVAVALVINGTCPSTPVTGSPVSLTLTAQGGVGPFTWTVVSPSWLRIGANGAATATFTGVPPTNGASDINITVTDSIQSPMARFTCGTVVQPRLQITASCSTTPYPAGSRLDIPVQATGGTGTYTYRVNSPSWLIYQAQTNSVSGIPPAVGAYALSITVTDSSGAQATTTCTINVVAALTLSGMCPGTALSDVPFGVSLTAQGGTAPYTFTVLYPGWLQLRSVRGNSADFGGLPAAGTTGDITVLVTDSSRWTSPFSCHVNFETPPRIPPLTLTGSCQTTSYPAGVRLEIPVSLVGGNGENVFRSISPSWLTYDPGRGKLTGVPPTAGAFNITAVAADGSGLQSTFGCSISVAPRLVANGVCQETVVSGSAMDVNVSVLGGTGPYQWNVVSPSWVQLKGTSGNTATFTGTAPAPGPASLQVRVVDSISSLPANFACSIKIDFPPINVTPPPPQTLPSGAGCPTEPVPAGQGLVLPYSVSGGSGTYRWTLGPAPAWMRLTNTTGPETTVVGDAPGDGVSYIVGITVTDDAGNVMRPSQCSFTTLEALRLQTTAPGELVVGAPWVVNFTGTGGVAPYQWSFSGPGWLTLSATSGPTVTLSGTPPNPEPFSCRVTFQDKVGSKPQSFDCSGKAALAPLSVNIVSTACPTDPLVFGQSFAGQLQAVGGDENYTWSVDGPSWLRSSPAGAFLNLSGSPDLIREYTYTVDLADGSGSAPARYACTLRVIPPGIPLLSMSLAPPTTLLEPVSVTLQLNGPAPITLTGDAELSFVPNAFGATDNPQVQWVEPAGQRRTFSFQIPEGARSVVLGRFQLGTVAGVASVTLTGLRGGGVSLLPGQSSGQVTVPVLAPVLTEIAFESETATGFTIVVTGYSTPRSLTSAAVTFNPRPGRQLTGSAGFTIDLTDTSRSYYQTPESQMGGSTFVLRFPVTVSGDKADIGSVTVVFSNSVGASTAVTRER